MTVIPASVLGVWSRAQWYPMQWLRDGKGLVIELSMVASGSKTGALATYEPGVFVVGSGTIRQIDRGRLPAVSPSSDRIAYYSSEGVVAADPDGTGRTVYMVRTARRPSRTTRSGQLSGLETEPDCSLAKLEAMRIATN